MNRLLGILAFAASLTACDETPRSIEAKADKAMKKVEVKAEELADSAKEKFKDVRDHVDSVIDREKRD